jgi:ADP-ribose pyrophosphatase YjhB (NUDIX family)
MLKSSVGIFFNFLNLLLMGNLPPLGCVSLIVQHQDKFLIIERPEGGYVFPGGFMRWREHPTQTALREGMEETGLKLKVIELIGCGSNSSERLTRMSTLTVIYYAAVVEGELRNSIEGRVSWQDEAELLEKILPQQRGIFEHFLNYREQGKSVKRFQVEN